jgi:hypothetical protein
VASALGLVDNLEFDGDADADDADGWGSSESSTVASDNSTTGRGGEGGGVGKTSVASTLTLVGRRYCIGGCIAICSVIGPGVVETCTMEGGAGAESWPSDSDDASSTATSGMTCSTLSSGSVSIAALTKTNWDLRRKLTLAVFLAEEVGGARCSDSLAPKTLRPCELPSEESETEPCPCEEGPAR